jgi:hypothetical protein
VRRSDRHDPHADPDLESATPTVQLIDGAVAAASAVLFVIFARENPPTPPCPPSSKCAR